MFLIEKSMFGLKNANRNRNEPEPERTRTGANRRRPKPNRTEPWASCPWLTTQHPTPSLRGRFNKASRRDATQYASNTLVTQGNIRQGKARQAFGQNSGSPRFGSVRFTPRSLNPRFGSTGSGSYRFRFVPVPVPVFFSKNRSSPQKINFYITGTG